MYKVVYSKQASKKYYTLPANIQRLIQNKMDQIAMNPFAPNVNVKKLQNRPGFRLRIGYWRVIYEAWEDKLVVWIVNIGSRGDVYR